MINGNSLLMLEGLLVVLTSGESFYVVPHLLLREC